MTAIYIYILSIISLFNMNEEKQDKYTENLYCKLIIHLDGLRNNIGNVLIGVYDSADGFPDGNDKVYLHKIFSAEEVFANPVTFNVPKNKKYAIAIIHDENQNNKLDTNFLGIPTEGYGFSNNKTGLLGAPTYKECSFEIADLKYKLINIKMKYW